MNLLPKDLRFEYGGAKLAPANLVTPLSVPMLLIQEKLL